VDNVNLAFSLEKFDPRVHQPQPPGYPLFVLFARIVNLLFNDATRTFHVLSILACALTLPLVFDLGTRLFGAPVGGTAVLLLIVNPALWYGSLDSPLRPYLALFSILVAYCSWRCWNGEKSYGMWGALALGVGSGFRPDLGLYLFPVWFVAYWMGTRSAKAVLKGIGVLAGVVLAWLGGMAYMVGGFGELYELNRDYAVLQSSQLTQIIGGWSRQLSRLIVWNGTAVVGCLWAIPGFLRSPERVKLQSARAVFLMIWLFPGLIFQAWVHVADPGHTLFSIPALCIASAYVIVIGARRVPQLREAMVGAALALNVLLFLGLFSLPAGGEPAGGWRSLRDAFLFRTFETSLGQLRFMDNTARTTLKELREFIPADHRAAIVSSDMQTVNWFMNWRIARYYLGSDIWVMNELESPTSVTRVHRDQTLEKMTGDPVRISVPRGGRVLWLIEADGPFHRELKKVQGALQGGTHLWYTDIASDAQPFRVMNVEFVPE
jgi:hypothetical protein